jgi:hypothetical protein
VANRGVFHHVVALPLVLPALIDAGSPGIPERLARRSPDNTAPLNRLGHYARRFVQPPQPLSDDLHRSPPLAVGYRKPPWHGIRFVLVPLTGASTFASPKFIGDLLAERFYRTACSLVAASMMPRRRISTSLE